MAEVNPDPPQDSDSTKASNEDVKIEKGTLLERFFGGPFNWLVHKL